MHIAGKLRITQKNAPVKFLRSDLSNRLGGNWGIVGNSGIRGNRVLEGIVELEEIGFRGNSGSRRNRGIGYEDCCAD